MKYYLPTKYFFKGVLNKNNKTRNYGKNVFSIFGIYQLQAVFRSMAAMSIFGGFYYIFAQNKNIFLENKNYF